MGAATSSDQKVSPEQERLESLASSIGALPMLRTSFSKLSDSHTTSIPAQSLKKCFCLRCDGMVNNELDGAGHFLRLLDQLGPSMVDVFFSNQETISWIEFVRGYLNCCGKVPDSVLLVRLLRLFAAMAEKSELVLQLEFEHIGDDDDDDEYGGGGGKINGIFLPNDVFMLLLLCWAMVFDSRSSSVCSSKGEEHLFLPVPDIRHLVLSAVVSCAEVGSDSCSNLWGCEISGLEVQLPAEMLLSWASSTLPNLSLCLLQFLNARLRNCEHFKDVSEPSTPSVGEASSPSKEKSPIHGWNPSLLMTLGRAWAISLAVTTSTLSKEILNPFFYTNNGEEAYQNLLYRSSWHGKGLNRFWDNIKGYHDPLLILISATALLDGHGCHASEPKFIMGALTEQCFENRDAFYGSHGCLLAICPMFHLFPPAKDHNFVYSHLQPGYKEYEPHPKPVGIGFGGTIGNERVFIDEDFSKITVRHHAVDRTYQQGCFLPNQGYLPVEGLISEVEAWGLGGTMAKKEQALYKRRQQLFMEQRRKVDLKTFGSWEDSPEKIMMSMMSNPNKVEREER